MLNNFIYYKKQINKKSGCDRAIRVYLLEYSAYNYNLLQLLLQFFITIILNNASAAHYLII